MTDELYQEYCEAISKLYKFCKKISWENKFLRQSLDAIYNRYHVGSGDDLPDEAIPLLAMGESFALTKFSRWSYEMRWELKGYYDENAWTPEYYETEEAQVLASICEEMVIDINAIESISRGNWNELFKMCWKLFDNIDKVASIYNEVIGETDKIIRTSQFKGSEDVLEKIKPLVVEGELKVNSVSAWHKTDEIATVTQIGFFVYEDHDEDKGIGITEKELNDWNHQVPNGKFKVSIEPVVEE